jgi:hypothetical protein
MKESLGGWGSGPLMIKIPFMRDALPVDSEEEFAEAVLAMHQHVGDDERTWCRQCPPVIFICKMFLPDSSYHADELELFFTTTQQDPCIEIESLRSRLALMHGTFGKMNSQLGTPTQNRRGSPV